MMMTQNIINVTFKVTNQSYLCDYESMLISHFNKLA